MSDSEIPATSWAVWAWQAYRAGRLVDADRIEELEAERDEVLNQLDSARHSVAVLEKRVKTFCEGWGVADKGRIDAESKLKTAEEIGRSFEEDAGQLREKLAKLRTFLDELWDSQGYDARELHDLIKEMDDE